MEVTDISTDCTMMNDDDDMREYEQEVTDWLNAIGDEPRNGRSLHDWLGSGQFLCRIANKIIPNANARVSRSSIPFKKLDNYVSFLKIAKDAGVSEQDLFHPQDLLKGTNMRSVLRCVYSFGVVIETYVPNFTGPFIGDCGDARASIGNEARLLLSPTTAKRLSAITNSSTGSSGSRRRSGSRRSTRSRHSTRGVGSLRLKLMKQPDVPDMTANSSIGSPSRVLEPKDRKISKIERALRANTPVPSTDFMELGMLGGGTISDLGDLDAITCFRKAVEVDPNNGRAWHCLGHACKNDEEAKQCRVRAALADLGKVEFTSDIVIPGPEAVSWNGDDPEFEPRKCFERVLETDSSLHAAWSGLGYVCGGVVRGTEFSERMCFERALELLGNAGDALETAEVWNFLGLAGGGSVGGRTLNSKGCYTEALRRSNSNSAAWRNLGLSGGGTVNGLHFSAEYCFRKATELDSGDAVAWKGLAAISPNRTSRTELYMKAIEASEGSDSASWLGLGSAHGGAVCGVFRDAKYCYEMSVTADPNNFAAWFRLGFLGGGLVGDEFKCARECYWKAIELKDFAPAWNNLGVILDANFGQESSQTVLSSRACYANAIESDGSYADPWFNLAHARGEVDASEGGVRALNPRESLCKALALKPQDADAWNNLGVEGGGETLGRSYSALQCFEQAVESCPEHEIARCNLKNIATSGSATYIPTPTVERDRAITVRLSNLSLPAGCHAEHVEIVHRGFPSTSQRCDSPHGENCEERRFEKCTAGDVFEFRVCGDAGLRIGHTCWGVSHGPVDWDGELRLIGATGECSLHVAVIEH